MYCVRILTDAEVSGKWQPGGCPVNLLSHMVRIHCINKERGNHYDPHEGITRFGWIDQTDKRGAFTREQMIAYLERGGKAYVRDRYGDTAMLVVRDRLGRKYVKTVADGRETDNLLFLSECPL
jgi:hypothetical protein